MSEEIQMLIEREAKRKTVEILVDMACKLETELGEALVPNKLKKKPGIRISKEAKALRNYRTVMNRTQEAMANEIGTTQERISMFERGVDTDQDIRKMIRNWVRDNLPLSAEV